MINRTGKRLVLEALDKKRVPLDQELSKWKNNGYKQSESTNKSVTLTKQKGKITHSVTIHHDGKHVIRNEVSQRGPMSALPKEQQKDIEQHKQLTSLHKARKPKQPLN